MDYKWIGFLGTCFVGMTIINRVLEGLWITGTDVGIMNQLSITQKVDVGFMSLPVPNMSFISGIFHMLQFDYSFFGGNAQLIQFAMYSISFMVAFMLFVTIIGLGINAIRTR